MATLCLRSFICYASPHGLVHVRISRVARLLLCPFLKFRFVRCGFHADAVFIFVGLLPYFALLLLSLPCAKRRCVAFRNVRRQLSIAYKLIRNVHELHFYGAVFIAFAFSARAAYSYMPQCLFYCAPYFDSLRVVVDVRPIW